jgi:hypothetical protein
VPFALATAQQAPPALFEALQLRPAIVWTGFVDVSGWSPVHIIGTGAADPGTGFVDTGHADFGTGITDPGTGAADPGTGFADVGGVKGPNDQI